MFKFLTETTIPETEKLELYEIPTASIILLKSKTQSNITKAEELLNKLLDLQINHTDSEYYGLWLHKEEYFSKQSKVFDKNMTTYIGIPLFILLTDYSQDLPEALIKRIKYALSIACVYILNRVIPLQASHIVISEGFLTAACGELLKNSEFTNYAINLLQRFHSFNTVSGSFTEFNATIYDVRSLSLLHLVKRYVSNEQILRISDLISDALWKVTAYHYHYHTGNIAGPSQRFPALFLNKNLKKFFSDACTSTRIKSSELTFYDICPDKYRAHFNGRNQNWYSQEIVSQGASYPYYLYSTVATTLIKPEFCIGSFNRGECWVERASFLGYFGTETSPFAFKVTTMHDGHEYASAQLFMLQHMNYILGHTSFAINRGDMHMTHDLTNGIIRAKDLRIRFFIAGDISKLNVSCERNSLNVHYENTHIKFKYSCAKFEGCKPKIQLIKDKELCFDLILHHGESKKIDFTNMKKAIASWMFCISDKEIPDFEIKDEFKNNYLITKSFSEDLTELSLESYYKPDTHENIQVNNRQYIQGIILEKYIQKSSSIMQQYSHIISNPESTLNSTLISKANIENLINVLSSSNEENIIRSVKEIFSFIYKNNITLMLVKRIAIQIISHVFAFYKDTNIRFESIIYDASQIYPLRIFSATDSETVSYHIFELLNHLHSSYISFKELEENQDLINQIIILIDNEYSNPNLSLEYIAEQCNKSIYIVSRTFKKISNLKYIDYLTNVRVDHAKEYLKNPKYTIQDISFKIGYLNPSSFIRNFKAKTGKTPNQYRRSLTK